MDRRADLRAIFNAGLGAVMTDAALLAHLRREGDTILAAGNRFDLGKGRVIVVGAGKGAAPMAQALESLIGDHIAAGQIVVKYQHSLKTRKIRITEAAHPVPDEAGAKAARNILRLASKANRDDLIICLFTGGASALLPAPAYGLALADLQKTTSLLLASGATIREINAIRKHLSLLQGGGLAEAAGEATLLALLVSDVIGDSISDIASGPTAPDTSTWQDCAAIIARYGLEALMPASVLTILNEGVNGRLAETPTAGSNVFARTSNVIIASNAGALTAAEAEARRLGYDARLFSLPMAGEARDCASSLIAKARAIRANLMPDAAPVCLLAGGETTVTLRGQGQGGRNQEMALAAAINLVSICGISCLFAGTDGTDGPTSAAGGFADGATAGRLGGIEVARLHLAANDSYNALNKAGDLFITGPTRTNVMDLAIILIEPEQNR